MMDCNGGVEKSTLSFATSSLHFSLHIFIATVLWNFTNTAKRNSLVSWCHAARNDRNSVSNMEVLFFFFKFNLNNKSHRSREIAMWYLQCCFFVVILLISSFLSRRLTRYSSWRLLERLYVWNNNGWRC